MSSSYPPDPSSLERKVVHRVGRDYTHATCGTVTTIFSGERGIFRTTWCAGCRRFVPVEECRWLNGSPMK